MAPYSPEEKKKKKSAKKGASKSGEREGGGALEVAKKEIAAFYSNTSINGFWSFKIEHVGTTTISHQKYFQNRRVYSSEYLLSKFIWMAILTASLVLCAVVISDVFLKIQTIYFMVLVRETFVCFPKI